MGWRRHRSSIMTVSANITVCTAIPWLSQGGVFCSGLPGYWCGIKYLCLKSPNDALVRVQGKKRVSVCWRSKGFCKLAEVSWQEHVLYILFGTEPERKVSQLRLPTLDCLEGGGTCKSPHSSCGLPNDDYIFQSQHNNHPFVLLHQERMVAGKSQSRGLFMQIAFLAWSHYYSSSLCGQNMNNMGSEKDSSMPHIHSFAFVLSLWKI